jgi:vacuolar protein sorting-associated protein VTA1
MLSGEYWVVNQILAKELHKSSNEMLDYTTHLMDKLEEVCQRLCYPR